MCQGLIAHFIFRLLASILFWCSNSSNFLECMVKKCGVSIKDPLWLSECRSYSTGNPTAYCNLIQHLTFTYLLWFAISLWAWVSWSLRAKLWWWDLFNSICSDCICISRDDDSSYSSIKRLTKWVDNKQSKYQTTSLVFSCACSSASCPLCSWWFWVHIIIMINKSNWLHK